MAKKFILSLLVVLACVFAGISAAKADNYVKEAENSRFVLYADQETLALKIVNKQSGYTWNSSYDNLANQGLNFSWQQFVSSAVTIDYINPSDKQRTANLVGGASVQIKPQPNGFRATVNFRLAGISLDLLVNLTDTGFEVQVPQSSISESTAGRLVDLNLYPFLGATKATTTSGYMLIPDGSGATISYQDSSQMTNAFQAPYYGADYGIAMPNANSNNNHYSLGLPVYGIVNGDNALLSYVKSGAEYGQLNAQKAGLNTNFNWITSKFTYRSVYQQPTSQSQGGAAVQMYQQTSNPVNIDIKFDLLSGDQANYTGLANALQKELVSEGILHKQTTLPSLMNLDFAGADLKPGLFWDSLSTFTQVNFIRSALGKDGLKQVMPSLFAFSSNGYKASNPNSFPFADAVGTGSDIAALVKANPAFALDLSYWPGVQASGIKNTAYLQQISGLTTSLLAPKSYPELVARDLKTIKQLGVKAVSVSGLGENLDSDYSAKTAANRTQALKEQENAFAQLKAAGLTIAAENPNLYAWKYLSAITALPTDNSNYTFETEAVPFLQQVVKGYLTTYSEWANGASDANSYLLKNIMMGSFPSYTLTQAPSSAFAKTSLNNFMFNTTYSNWQKQLKSDYQVYQAVAAATQGATVESQTSLATGVTKTVYSNGTVILVNNSSQNYRDKNYSIDRGKYEIIVGGGK